jgi:GNAT superfamily N-acetyltransferase
MEPADGSARLLQAIQRIKQGAAAFTTNLFAGQEQIESWIERGDLFHVERNGSMLILRRDRDFHHLYHVAAGNQELSGAIALLDEVPVPGGVLVADLVGRPEEVSTTSGIYAANGFREYTSLVRMVRLAQSALPESPEDAEAVLASVDDVPDISCFLEKLLDRFRDQIPEPSAIRTAAGHGSIIIVRRGGPLAGLLFFETAGLTSVLRYWYVASRFRSQGIGAQLIRAYFRRCRSVKRILLWVVSDNADAIAKYEHYGFRRECLVDRIMISEEGALA